MRLRCPFLEVLVEERPASQERLQVGRERGSHEGLDRLAPCLLPEMDAVGMPLVARFAVLPGHHGVVLERVEPGAHQAVAALDLVVEERERQVAVHRLDPERQPAQLHRERVEIHAVDAALDDVTAEDGLEPGLEGLVRRPAAKLFGPEQVPGLRRGAAIEQVHDRPLASFRDASVMVKRGVQGVGKKPQRGHGERAGAARRVAHLEREDLFRCPGRPRRGGCVEMRLAVSTDLQRIG